jgi:4-amino-4-deoxy-L-arabinose transferase-like glycosyltransferase
MSKKLIRYISIYGVGVYLLALLVISVVFRDHAMELEWVLWGIGEVLFFFVFTTVFYPRWKNDKPKVFCHKVFWIALAIRLLYVVFSYYYFYNHAGGPFEGSGDEVGYYTRSALLSKYIRKGDFGFVFDFLKGYSLGFSDHGYLIWLTFIHTIFGRKVWVARIFKALMSAYLCIVVHRLSSRTFGERTGRLAAVMCVFMPLFIQLTGSHIKEMEMIFLSILALERMDYLIRSKKYTLWNILFPILLIGMSFGFRTVIGMCLIFAFLVFVILSPNHLVNRKGKIVALSTTLVVFLVFLFTVIGSEMKIVYMLNFSGTDYLARKYESLGLKYSELSKSKYLFPGAFVLPLSPMVDVAPDHNKMFHGTIFIKNFLAFFAMLSIVIAIRQKKCRDFSLIGAYELSYLAIVMFTFTSNSERYHQPAVPLILVMAAYAMTRLRRKDLTLFYIYCGLLFVALFAWNWIKLAARGMV